MLKNKTDIVILVLLVFGLTLIRAFENELFYDPFLKYFKLDYYNLPLPKVKELKLLTSYFFRYFLNSTLSLLVIYTVFKDVKSLKFLAVLYLVLFVVLSILFFLILFYVNQDSKMTLFYVRRFIIQPLFLLLFLAGFYFQKISISNKYERN